VFILAIIKSVGIYLGHHLLKCVFILVISKSKVIIAMVEFCKMMNLKEIRYKPATSTFLSVVGLALKSSHTQNMLLHIELKATGTYIFFSLFISTWTELSNVIVICQKSK
jgi:hypothetical protein